MVYLRIGFSVFSRRISFFFFYERCFQLILFERIVIGWMHRRIRAQRWKKQFVIRLPLFLSIHIFFHMHCVFFSNLLLNSSTINESCAHLTLIRLDFFYTVQVDTGLKVTPIRRTMASNHCEPTTQMPFFICF